MSYGQHLKRSRHGSLAFRYKVPVDVVPILGCGELTLGLGTSNRREAGERATFLKSLMLTLVRHARTMNRSPSARLDLDAVHPALDTLPDRTSRPRRAQLSALLRQHLEDHFHQHVLRVMPDLAVERQETAWGTQPPDAPSPAVPAKDVESVVTDEVRSLRQLLEQLPINVIAGREPVPAVPAVDEIDELRRMRRLQGLQIEGGQMPISELFKGYCDAQRGVWKNWHDRVRRDYDPARDLLIDELGGDLAIERLTVDHVGRFARRVKADGATKDSASATMKKRLDFFKAVLRWANKQALLQDITGPLHMEKENESYEAFTAEELRQLFECTHYRQHTFRRASQFWVPLLGLYTGARINEIASIRLEHIRTVNGILGIEVSPGGRKTGKNEHSRRFVPVHPALVTCGFDRYVETLRTEGHEELFPCLPDAKRDGKGKRASEEFAELRRSLAIGSQVGEGRGTKVFHSFRSTLVTQMQCAGVPSYLRKELEGHASRDTHDVVYSQGQTPQTILLDALSKATFAFEHPVWQDTDDHQYARINGCIRPVIKLAGRH